jgi:hypothetical protein
MEVAAVANVFDRFTSDPQDDEEDTEPPFFLDSPTSPFVAASTPLPFGLPLLALIAATTAILATATSSPRTIFTGMYKTSGPGQNLEAKRRKASRLSEKLAACNIFEVLLLVEAAAVVTALVEEVFLMMGV